MAIRMEIFPSHTLTVHVANKLKQLSSIHAVSTETSTPFNVVHIIITREDKHWFSDDLENPVVGKLNNSISHCCRGLKRGESLTPRGLHVCQES